MVFCIVAAHILRGESQNLLSYPVNIILEFATDKIRLLEHHETIATRWSWAHHHNISLPITFMAIRHLVKTSLHSQYIAANFFVFIR